MKRGTECLADALELRKLTLSVTPLGPTITAVFALINSKTRTVVSWKKKATGWPAETLKLPLREFLSALENAAAGEVFADHEEDEAPRSIAEYLEKSRSEF